MCYTERDTLEVMLTKTGTITQSATKARVQDQSNLDTFPETAPHTDVTVKETAENETSGAQLVRQNAKGGTKKKKKHDKHGGAMVSRRNRDNDGDIEMAL